MLGMVFPWAFLRPEAEMYSQISSEGAQPESLRKPHGVSQGGPSLLPDPTADCLALSDPIPRYQEAMEMVP